MTATVDNAIADLRRANAELRRQLDEALQRETATAEVLGVINSSPTDLEAVFDAMLERALRLCEAAFGVLWRYDGERFYAAGLRGVSAAFAEALRTPIHSEPGAALYRLEHGERLAHFSDVMAEAAYRSGPGRALVELGGARTLLAVPLRKDDHSLLGAFATFRQEVRPFSDKQIALLENFATQAVIAIENARLITETREALEQQTATAEVLQVINSSPGDLAPVFSAILEKAARLCEAAFGVLWTHEGEAFRAAALRGVPPAYAEFVTRQPRGSRPGGALGRLALGETMVHVPDTSIDGQKDPVARTLVELGGIRTLLAVSLRKDNELLGAFTIYRQEVRPFTDKQIALLQNFAAQAVIAMENARLISETREALEQQTATAEVLQVINASPGDLAPVFDAILEKAHSLCEAAHGVLATYDGESFRAIATRGLPDPLATLMRRPFRPLAGSPHERLLRGERVVQISDLAAETVWTADDPKRRSSLEMGIRTLLFVPLRKDDNLLGYISADRLEVRPFSEREIALLENFAAQAVIAMENARLITETREALDQQTATAEVLQVINSSPGDLAPVFDAMLDKALHLCGAAFGVLWTYSVDRFRPTAHRGVPPPMLNIWRARCRQQGQELVGPGFWRASPSSTPSILPMRSHTEQENRIDAR